MTYSEKPLDFRDGYLPAAAGLPIVPTVKAASLLGGVGRLCGWVCDPLPDCPGERVQGHVGRRGGDGSRRPLIG